MIHRIAPCPILMLLRQGPCEISLFSLLLARYQATYGTAEIEVAPASPPRGEAIGGSYVTSSRLPGTSSILINKYGRLFVYLGCLSPLYLRI
jgi:hypothetical protein